MSTFEVVRGVEGDCLVLDGTRICGPKPWGGGRIIKTFHTDGIYEVIYKDEYHKLLDENARLRSCLSDDADNARQIMGENAKLREIIVDLEKLLPESERRYIHETVKAIAEDNAKLRKLLLDVWNDAMQFDGFWNYVNDDGEIYNEDELPHYQERMRELGIEVN